ncbi:MAG TPA: hypothetical protein PLT16_16105, partial [Daejeonella sp.]
FKNKRTRQNCFNGLIVKIKICDMEWTLENFPVGMNDLEPKVMEKAIEIANQLKKEGRIKESSIVDEAIQQAQEWFLNMEG